MTNSSTTSADRPFAWRITRYDPARRDEKGAFPADDWTSVSDVGSAFSGTVLTLEEYQRVERLYVEAACRFAEECRADEFAVTHVEHGESLVPDSGRVSAGEFSTLVALMLREDLICRIEAVSNSFQLDVGFDLYMFIETDVDCPLAVAEARLAGLFVEEGHRSQLWAE